MKKLLLLLIFFICAFQLYSQEALSIDAAGNIGIGIRNPEAKLHVDGNIVSNGIVTTKLLKSEAGYNGTVDRDTFPTVELNLVSGNVEVDMTSIFNGGLNEKLDGWQFEQKWIGGDGTYCIYFILPSGFTIDSKFVSLVPGDGISTFAWTGWGTGGFTFIKDELNSRLIIAEEGCFDFGDTINNKWERYTNKQIKLVRKPNIRLTTSIYDPSNGYHGHIVETFLFPFSSVPIIKSLCILLSGAHCHANVYNPTVATVHLFLSGLNSTNYAYLGYEAEGEW